MKTNTRGRAAVRRGFGVSITVMVLLGAAGLCEAQTGPLVDETGDVPALVPATGLEAVARSFAKIIDEVNTLDLLELQPVQMGATQ